MAPHPGVLLDPNINNATFSSMKLGIMLHDDTSPVSTGCDILHNARSFNHEVQLRLYDVRFISSTASGANVTWSNQARWRSRTMMGSERVRLMRWS